MKRILFVLLMLLSSRAFAQSQESFPSFVTGQSAGSSITGTELAPVIQSGATIKPSLNTLKSFFSPQCSTSTLGACKPDGTTITSSSGVLSAVVSGVPNTTVLSPIAGDNAAAFTAALTASPTVLLSPGYYEVCSQVDIPRYRTLYGLDGVRQGIGNQVPSYPFNMQPTVVGSNGCPNGGNGSFAGSGQGYFHLHDNITLTGFAIQGQRQIGGHNNINCINAENAATIVIFGMTLVDCYVGVDRLSSSVSGDTGSISQTAIISNNSIPYSEFVGIQCGTGSGGNGCSDERYNDNWIDVPFNEGIDIAGGIQFQILNNRIEDGGYGIVLEDAKYGVISNNFFNRIQGFLLIGVDLGTDITITNNKMSGVEPGNVDYGIQFGSSYKNLVISNNIFSYGVTAAFKVNSGGLADSSVFGNRYGNTDTGVSVPVYFDDNTACVFVNNTPTSVTPKGSVFLHNDDACFQAYTASASILTQNFDNGPSGDHVAAQLKEDGTTSTHRAFATRTLSLAGGTFTSMVSVAPGTSGTRNGYLQVDDGTNSVIAIVNPSTCAVVGTATAGGAAVIVKPASALSLGGGWCRLAVTYSGVNTATQRIGLSSGSTASYAGDTTSNLLFFSNNTYSGFMTQGGILSAP